MTCGRNNALAGPGFFPSMVARNRGVISSTPGIHRFPGGPHQSHPRQRFFCAAPWSRFTRRSVRNLQANGAQHSGSKKRKKTKSGSCGMDFYRHSCSASDPILKSITRRSGRPRESDFPRQRPPMPNPQFPSFPNNASFTTDSLSILMVTTTRESALSFGITIVAVSFGGS